jgi:predicted small integral membrane protein
LPQRSPDGNRLPARSGAVPGRTSASANRRSAGFWPAVSRASRSVAQAGSLPYRGLVIREPCAGGKALVWTDASPTASRRYGRLAICATAGARSIAPPATAASLPSRRLLAAGSPTASRRHGRLAICATTGARSIAPPVGLRTFARSDAPRSEEVCAVMPATAASADVAQAGSLPYRGLVIREPCAGGKALVWTDASPTASRRYGRLAICATGLGRAGLMRCRSGRGWPPARRNRQLAGASPRSDVRGILWTGNRRVARVGPLIRRR